MSRVASGRPQQLCGLTTEGHAWTAQAVLPAMLPPHGVCDVPVFPGVPGQQRLCPRAIVQQGRPEIELQEAGCYGFLQGSAIEIAF